MPKHLYIVLIISLFYGNQALIAVDASYLSDDAKEAHQKIEQIKQKITDPAIRSDLENLKTFLTEKLSPPMTPEAKKARDMTEQLLKDAIDPAKPIAEILKDQVNPLLSHLQSEELQDEAFYMYKNLNDLLSTHGTNPAIADRIVSILSRIGESSRPLIKSVLEDYTSRIMREAMNTFYNDPDNVTNARAFIETVRKDPTLLSNSPGLAVLLVPQKSILEKGGKIALEQILSLMNGLDKVAATTILWSFAHPSLKAPAWIDFFLKLQERHRNLQSDIAVDLQKLSGLERVLHEFLPTSHKENFKEGMDKLRTDMAQKGPILQPGQKEYEAMVAEFGPNTPFDVNKYGPNPAMLLFRLSPEDAATTLKKLLGAQMRINRTAFYSLLSFTNEEQRKGLTYFYKTLSGIGGTQRTELLNNLPTSSKQRTKFSKNDVKKFTQTLNELPVADRAAVNDYTPTLAPPVATPKDTVPPPPPSGTGVTIPPPPPPPPLSGTSTIAPTPSPPPSIAGGSGTISSSTLAPPAPPPMPTVQRPAEMAPLKTQPKDLMAQIRARGGTTGTLTKQTSPGETASPITTGAVPVPSAISTPETTTTLTPSGPSVNLPELEKPLVIQPAPVLK